MKDILTNPSRLSKLEFWAATTIFIFSVFLLITAAIDNDFSDMRTSDRYRFEEAGISFNYYRHYLIPQLLRYATFYLAFLVLNLIVVPKLLIRQDVLKHSLLILLVFLVSGLVFGTTDTYLKNYLLNQYSTTQEAYNAIFLKSFLYAFWLLLLFGFYCVSKYISIYLLTHSETIQPRYRIIIQDGLFAFVLWLLSMLLLVIGRAEEELIIIWGVIIPFAILLYCYALYTLIPSSLGKKFPFRAYIGKTLLLLIISIIPMFLFTLLITNDVEAAVAFGFFNVPFQLFFTAPVSWGLYKRRMKGKEEIYTLKKELGQSHANLDFLRSQINPHFLFNALNTIYGTAIHEKAERTCEAVERLGDMMRFMLQENMQEKISLAREIDYLNNYISLQRLRTDTNPIVRIDACIEQQVNLVQISPMLLIPFVENAFKHGISLREPSHIRVTLDVKDQVLYFDVNNSKHHKPENDPEKDKSGIGLNNVKQRLQLLYPVRHELIIRETSREFFVHLTIQLT
jgi:hypothetical protein